MITHDSIRERALEERTREDRALGALQGLALGDALGMPTQAMSPQAIHTTYGPITGLRDADASQPYAPLMPAGSVTDDTEQALLLASLLLEGKGHIDPLAYANALLDWEDAMAAKGSLDLLGPSTKAALEQVRTGADPRQTGRFGTTNGAPMRVAPVGIAYSLDDSQRFSVAVHESCMVTHDTHQGWQGAAMVAAAVSAGVEGAGVREAITTSVDLLSCLSPRGHWAPNASVLERTKVALARAGGLRGPNLTAFIRAVVGTSVECTESVPAAFAVAYAYAEEPFEGLCLAAGLGGDTDTIGAIAGAILGAGLGAESLPHEEVKAVCTVSGLDLAPLSRALLDLRAQHSLEPREA